MAKILVYDDEKNVGIMVSRVISHLGHEAVFVPTVEMALKEMQIQDKYALGIFDGSGRGWEVAQALSDAGWPVVVFSGDPRPDGYTVQCYLKGGGMDLIRQILAEANIT